MQNDKLPVKIENYSYAKFISELLDECQKHRIEYKIIGFKEFGGIGMEYPIYRCAVNLQAKRKICLVSGIHGYEIAGPLTMLWLFKKPSKYFDKNISYYIYPVINPVSFDLRQRFNSEGADLNVVNSKILKDEKYIEAQYFFNDVEEIKFDAFISLHEDVDREDFYAYVFENKEELVYREIIKNASRYCKIWKAEKIYSDKTDKNGLIINKYDQSFEDRIFQLKKAKLSLCTETPGKLDIETRIKINLDNIKILSDFIL